MKLTRYIGRTHKLYEEAYKQGKSDAIDECKQILKTQHMIRTCEDDYIAGIEAPFYMKLWKEFDELKEKK